jgi:hypothetical protein
LEALAVFLIVPLGRAACKIFDEGNEEGVRRRHGLV